MYLDLTLDLDIIMNSTLAWKACHLGSSSDSNKHFSLSISNKIRWRILTTDSFIIQNTFTTQQYELLLLNNIIMRKKSLFIAGKGKCHK